MAVFENESNASQDANYREHLNRNWDNGNNAFDNLFGKYNGLLDEYDAVNSRLDDAERKIRDLQDKNIALNQRCDTIEEKHNDDIEATNQRLTKLEKAVFEAQYINDTDDVADHDKSVVLQDINDTNVIDDDDGLIIEQDNYKSLPSDIS
ncbi:hypothetical protein [Lactobacillus crispatus]|uniref:Prophage protein n=1 Tax=Lactobacillus crispatus TaxID=47770 RepID=A0AAW4DNB8_9LACO|nr:hypothetical protein [Lactobacillus crispatus]MBI1708231.1 prophage protein [Lactobacillus crispatus]